MSADNFNIVRKNNDGTYSVWLNLSASWSDDQVRQEIQSQEPDGKFDAMSEAFRWAEAQGWTEYGTEFITEGTGFSRDYGETSP